MRNRVFQEDREDIAKKLKNYEEFAMQTVTELDK